MKLNKTKSEKRYSWFLAIVGSLSICWVIYDIVATFTYFNEPKPLRSALISGQAAIDYPLSTLILMWLMWFFWVVVGVSVLYSGIKRIRKPKTET